ncbi:MAG: hypothetical protein IT460_11845 [Planctomycetes bacterium]|nr:hypothetical protein [Planctomycetota bacterium]
MIVTCGTCRAAVDTGHGPVGSEVVCGACGATLVVPGGARVPPPPPPRPSSSSPRAVRPLASAPPASSRAPTRLVCPACDTRYPVADPTCPRCGRSRAKARRDAGLAAGDDDSFAFERKAAGSGVLGGVALMTLAVVWFVLGWRGGRIFFYPPVLFVVGLVAFARGLTGRS